MKVLNVKVWMWISSVIVTLAGIASFVGAQAGAKLAYGSAISGSELYNLTTDQAGWSLAVLATGLTLLAITMLTSGTTRAKLAFIIGLIFTLETVIADIYASGRHAHNPTAFVILTLIIPALTGLAGWVNRNNKDA
jgi:hypothetical protein